MYKKHKWFSGLRNICTFSQLRQICDLTVCFKTLNLCPIAHLAQCKLIGKSFEITYVSYTSRWRSVKKHPTTLKHMRLKTIIIITFLTAIHLDSNAQEQMNNRVIGIFSQQIFYRFTIVEFKSDLTFDYHIMSERAHRQTSGKYSISGDTITLNSYSKDTDFDFQNKKWIILSRKQIIISDNLNDRKENWSILERDNHFDSIPKYRSDFSLKIDSIKINELSWIKDTTNYDSELKVIIREPLYPKEPIVIINGEPVKYNFNEF